MSHNYVENVIKQGYLRKGNFGASRLSGLFRRSDVNKWFVFTIRHGVPYLEYYDSDLDVFTQQPINSFNLSSCQNVKSMGNSHPPSFCIVCPDRIIELIASSRTQMVDWINELEGSLTHLGILKNEIVDHVYTVCPAVVRKPRISKEAADEEAATESTLTGIMTVSSETPSFRHSSDLAPQEPSSSSMNPVLPPRSSSLSWHRATSHKSTRPTLAGRMSSSFHASSRPISPPPLPSRKASHSTVSIYLNDAEIPPRNCDSRPSLPAIEGSNDSDFVPPEVIAQLRQQHHANKKAASSAPLATKTDSDLPQSTTNVGKVATNKTYFHSISLLDNQSSVSPLTASSAKHHVPELTNSLQTQVEPATPLEILSGNLDDALLSSNQQTDPPLLYSSDDIFRNSGSTLDNDYSEFPGQKDGPEIGALHIGMDSVCSELHNVKPTPVTRRGVTSDSIPPCEQNAKKSVCPSQDSVNEDTCLKTGVPQSNNSCHNSLYGNGFADGEFQIDEGDYTYLKQDSNVSYDVATSADENYNCFANDYSNTLNVQTPSNNKNKNEFNKTPDNSIALPSKQNSTELAKDENENIYDSPPSMVAPPAPLQPSPDPSPPRDSTLPPSKTPVPPLPPRHESLRGGSRKPANRQESLPSSLIIPASSLEANLGQQRQKSSTLPPSAFSVTAFNKYNGLPTSSSSIPPLPLPRRSGSKSDANRKSLPPAKPANADSVKPKPVFITTLSSDLALDSAERPPLLPSKNLQSFIIKRPQITGGMPGHLRHSFDDNTGINNFPLAPPVAAENPQSSRDNRSREAEPRTSANLSNLPLSAAPDRTHSLHTVVSPKQTQAELLQAEISHGSISVSIPPAAGSGIALVDWNSCACIVGWNQKEFPGLQGKLHVGDLILAVNGKHVTSAETANKLLRQGSLPSLTLLLRRMPYAKVFTVHCSAEGQSLGFKREGGTGEIVSVDPNGLAAQHGLSCDTGCTTGSGRCNWFLTEINNRPVSLFFKENEIEQRLAAAGREVFLVVQPSDLVKNIRRQFKKLKNYKNFIVQ